MEKDYATLALNYELLPVKPSDRSDLSDLSDLSEGLSNSAPARLMLIPPGSPVVGRDGRAWNNPDPASIIRFFQERGLKIPIDIEHATELKAPRGDEAPARGWCVDLSAEADGSVWAQVEWNAKGAELVTNREYSYYSPAIIFDKATMNIVGIKSVGLTNTPNFDIPALNRQNNQEENTMKRVLALLGLAETATEEMAVNSISALKAEHAMALNHAASPPLDKFVPRADHDLALNRASQAEAKLAAQEKAALETAINHEIEAALAAGKITPATKEYHVAQCRQEGGLERFKGYVALAPTVAAASGLDKKKPDTGTALNAEDLEICERMGLSVEDYKKANGL